LSVEGKIVLYPFLQETWETRYEQLMHQFASDMNLYIGMVCDTIVMTVPKSVVHCLVRKAEKNLLNHLFGHVHAMSETEIARMLQVRGVERQGFNTMLSEV
jgi:hypothetical protein